MNKQRLAILAAAALVGCFAVGALASQSVASPSAHAAKKCKKKKGTKHKKCTKTTPSPQGAPGAQGPPGPTGPTGPTGPNGPSNQTTVTTLPGNGFSVTNSSCSLTPDGVECGPYADGGAAGGSLFYSGLNGQPLSAVRNLAYYARYTSDGDTGGVGVPYLRIFTTGDAHDAVFSPNTQPPDPDTAEGPFHDWVATSGVWRYDDDAGAGGPGTYGVNGAPFSTLVADHGTETISGIYITTGFSAGVNLNSLTRSVQVNGRTFLFGG